MVVRLLGGVEAAATAMASCAVNFSIVPWPIAAMRSIQSSTAGVAFRISASTEVRIRVNHNGWYIAKSVMHGTSPSMKGRSSSMSDRRRKYDL